MIVIIDYGMGNLRSIQKKMIQIGVNAEISKDIKIIADGTSCRCQIKDGMNRQAIHVARFLDENIIY